MSFFNFLDLLGTVAFAISGSLVAMNKKMDLFGIFIIGFVTAVGGGTIRDILIGNTPVVWMEETYYIYVIGLSVIFSIACRNYINYLAKSLFLFDTIGLGIFTIIGVEIGLRSDLDPIICIALGATTGCFGGVIRDILCSRVPVIFRREIYATASIAGGFFFILLRYLGLNLGPVYIGTILLIILIRILVVKYSISLPSFFIREGEKK
ncbi:MAG TPA: trimeric intracellular cation channel family protein [Salinimicrobium sp.]|nr:trimeric intracellular cation channel family protein [Salinimicrobium sp.]